MSIFCTHCGSKLNEKDGYCGVCGKKVENPESYDSLLKRKSTAFFAGKEKKPGLLIALCMVLVAAISIAGTMLVLSNGSDGNREGKKSEKSIEERIVGQWAYGEGESCFIEFFADGDFHSEAYSGYSGEWSISGNKLKLKDSWGDIETWEVDFDGDTLLLDGYKYTRCD